MFKTRDSQSPSSSSSSVEEMEKGDNADTAAHQQANKNTTDVATSHRTFPIILHGILEECHQLNQTHIASWIPDQPAFKVWDPNAFVQLVLPRFVRQTRYKSFQRQLNLWGFQRITSKGKYKGGYFHPLFVQGRPDLCRNMERQQVHVGGKAAAAAAKEEDEANWAATSQKAPPLHLSASPMTPTDASMLPIRHDLGVWNHPSLHEPVNPMPQGPASDHNNNNNNNNNSSAFYPRPFPTDQTVQDMATASVRYIPEDQVLVYTLLPQEEQGLLPYWSSTSKDGAYS